LSRSGRRLRLLSVLVLLSAAAAAPAAEGLLVAVGDVTSTGAVLWLRGPAPGEARVRYRPATAGADSAASLSVALGRASDLTAKVRLTGLAPGTRYAYRVESAGEAVDGEFATAPPADTPARVKFLWSGDLGGGKVCRPAGRGFRIFRAMAAERADFFLFVGDTVYADQRCDGPDVVPGSDFVAVSLAGFRAKHRYNRQDPAAAAFYATTPVFAIWDDHEVRNDFAGTVEPLMPVGRQAFLEYWPILPPDEEPGRLYRSFRWGRLLEVFILDTRQYRSPNTEPDGPGKTMLGPAQRRWLIEGVSGSTATWKVVVSSVPLAISTGRIARDSWSSARLDGTPEVGGTGFAVERDAILRAFRSRGVRNLIVLAADVHHAELIRHHPWSDFSFHEFIAGPLAATHGWPRILDRSLNPRPLFARGGVNNYGEITIEPETLRVRVVDEDGRTLFSHVIGPD
jgi:alkaline phosphatase D